jgi:hypothetical protein
MRKITSVSENQNSGHIDVWHGTNSEFEKFDLLKMGSGNGAHWNGIGFYFSDSKAEASLYGNKLMRCRIFLSNPFDLTKTKDTSCWGSGIVRALASIGLYDKTVVERLNQVEKKFDPSLVQISGDGKFKNVWIEYDDKEYVVRNKTAEELDPKNLKRIYVTKILNEVYKISIPQKISDVCSAREFTDALKKNGYDGVIAHNSTVPTGNEYVVFNPEEIEILD